MVFLSSRDLFTVDLFVADARTDQVTDLYLVRTKDGSVRRLTGSSRERVPVFSAGVGLRFNILGRLVNQVYWAHPFQRDASGGQWGFVLAPGW